MLRTDMDRHIDCPDPLTRAPRPADPARQPRERLYLASPALQGAVAAVICRDIRGAGLDSVQRLSHFAASPLLCLSWFQDFEVGLVERSAGGPRWRPFGAAVVLSGSQSRPVTSWAPSAGRGVMVCFTADVARTLFELDVGLLHDRFVAAHEVLATTWWPLLDALLAAPDDASTLAALEHHLAPRWQALQQREQGASPLPSLRRLGRHWLERLAWQAHEWRRTHSPRQVERRIKALSGRSLRAWQALVRTEGVLFSARERHAAGQPFDWPGLALEEGFADQAHLIRATRHITGFTPNEFARRFIEDESFWLYRLWV